MMIEFEEEEFFDDPGPRTPVKQLQQTNNTGSVNASPRWDGPVIDTCYSGSWAAPDGASVIKPPPPQASSANVIVIAPEADAVGNHGSREGPPEDVKDIKRPAVEESDTCHRCHGVIKPEPPDEPPGYPVVKTEVDPSPASENHQSLEMPKLEPEPLIRPTDRPKSSVMTPDLQQGAAHTSVVGNAMTNKSDSEDSQALAPPVTSDPPCQCSCHDCGAGHVHNVIKTDPDAEVVQVKTEQLTPDKPQEMKCPKLKRPSPGMWIPLETNTFYDGVVKNGNDFVF